MVSNLISRWGSVSDPLRWLISSSERHLVLQLHRLRSPRYTLRFLCPLPIKAFLIKPFWFVLMSPFVNWLHFVGVPSNILPCINNTLFLCIWWWLLAGVSIMWQLMFADFRLLCMDWWLKGHCRIGRSQRCLLEQNWSPVKIWSHCLTLLFTTCEDLVRLELFDDF